LFGGEIPPNQRVSVSQDKARDKSRRHQTESIIILKDGVSAPIALSRLRGRSRYDAAKARLEQKKSSFAIFATLR
jgi:hypothetical protein